MKKYLLVAEADRIQDLIFRSSQLREVVGGSQLLKRFGDEDSEGNADNTEGVLPCLARALKIELGVDIGVITSGGGSFYLEFTDPDIARRFGSLLAEAYYRTTGGTLSVSEPVAYLEEEKEKKEGGYKKASEEAGASLRQAKRRGPFIAVTQMPYIAFCESCGVGLAEAHEQRFVEEGEEGQGQYLCPSCRIKAAERVDQSLGKFLKPFYAKIVKPALLEEEKVDWPEDADSVGELDPRNYVAYIIADGNDMGQVFRGCHKEQAKALSKRMHNVLQASLAAPIKTFLNAAAGNEIQQFIPVLPLIMGGDDLFALVPARWALDIAGRLCRNFQEQMTDFAREQGILEDSKAITMTAAVVICKANYPYHLAHEVGHKRVAGAKRVVKALAQDKKEPRYLSAVDFEVILGSRVEHGSEAQACDYTPTLRPYWVLGDAQPTPTAWGLPLDALLAQRLALAESHLPARRRSQLRDLMDQVPCAGNTALWNKELERLLARVERDARWRERHPLRQALEALGGLELESWLDVNRTSDQRSWQGNGMGDLLRVWDWALRIDEDPSKYEGGPA